MSRLFVAIRPPAPVRETLLAAMDDDPAIRWQDDDQLHLTLAFLGEVDRGAERDLADALTAIDSPPFDLEIRGVGHFERKGMPSALWAGRAERTARTPAAARRLRLPPLRSRARSQGLPPARHARPAEPLEPARGPLAGSARHPSLRAVARARVHALRKPPVARRLDLRTSR